MSEKILIKQDLDTWLDNVDYAVLNSSRYLPTEFALTFMNFVKLVNGQEGESHKTPPVHLRMLDRVTESPSDYIANLCFRGAAKTTLFMEYMCLYLGTFGYLPGHGPVSGMLYLSDSMDNGVKNARRNLEFRYNNSEFAQQMIPRAKFTDNYIELGNQDGHLLGIKMFGAKTGLRGSKVFGKRPTLAILDDLLSDDDANSKAAMETISDTVYKGVNHAMDPTRRKVILNGTPFHKEDIMVQAVESGGWEVNVWPVCERFPCSEEDFVGAWPDRFTYQFVKEQYEFSVATGKVAAFLQELMLRITSTEDRLIQDADCKSYSRQQLLQNKNNFNFYITTDFATSEKSKADYSVIFVWAYNNNGDWFWVDGVMKRQTMDKSINDLFRLVAEYGPQQVGIEVSGQQNAFIKWLEQEQMNRNIWFPFASSSKTGEPGIRPDMDKLRRLNLVVPWFKAGKMYFPEEMKQSEVLGLLMGQYRLATAAGIKGKDDGIDGTSQLAYLTPFKPSQGAAGSIDSDGMWDDVQEREGTPLDNYQVS